MFRWLVVPLLVLGVVLGPGAAGAATAEKLLYRCYPNLCKVGADGEGKRQLTRDGKRGGPV